jgi:CHRD domain
MRYVVFAVLAALVVAAGATGAVQKGGSLHATLTGKVEVPKGDPNGTGTAEVKITGAKVCWQIKTANVETIVAAHIHKGGPGVAGPVVVPFGKTFKSKGCVTSTTAIVAAIEKNPAGYYVNVHNAKYPGGALRGQLRSDG